MPDLPRVLTDAPDTRICDPSARTSVVRLPELGRRVVAVAVAGLLATTLSAAWLVSTARADGLDDRQAELKQQISKTRTDLNESSAALSRAGVQVDQAASRLSAARAELARTQTALAAAKAKDKAMAAKLTKAKAALAAAKAAVVACQQRLDAKKAMVGVMVRDAYQQQTNLMPIAALTAPNTGDLATRVQWATTMFDTTQSKIDELLALETQLKSEQARLAKAEAVVAQDRADAAASLKETKHLEAQARGAAAAVADQLAQQQAVESAAAQDVAQDKAQYSKLTAERATVEHRIAVRIAKEKAAAAKAARAAKAAAARRAAATAAEKASRAAKSAKSAKSAARSARSSASSKRVSHSSSSARVSTRSTASSSSSGSHHGFIYPVSAPITSPYGMRFHPVLHYWKLHDGTDFGAGCGTAMHAAYDGVVAEKYYNAGYGNRLMIDHGKVDGTYVTTGYNHAIRYVVGVGDHVKQGQVIGYVGTTGFSTGCHLHLMVWLNGRVVNPMSWY